MKRRDLLAAGVGGLGLVAFGAQAKPEAASLGFLMLMSPQDLFDARVTNVEPIANYVKATVAKIADTINVGTQVAPVSLSVACVFKPPGRVRPWVANPNMPDLEKRLQPSVESVPFSGKVTDGPVALIMVVDINGGDGGSRSNEGATDGKGLYMPQAWRPLSSAQEGEVMDDAFFNRVWPD